MSDHTSERARLWADRLRRIMPSNPADDVPSFSDAADMLDAYAALLREPALRKRYEEMRAAVVYVAEGRPISSSVRGVVEEYQTIARAALGGEGPDG